MFAVIMAGGSGTRFWPASRAARPKQLLDLTGGRTMIQATVDRLSGLVPSENVLIVSNQRLTDDIAQQLPELPEGSLVGEPCKRDTAPCIGLAAFLVSRQDPDATMAVMPADHVIQPAEKFQEAISLAGKLVDEDHGRIVTFGIKPTYPAESFGYIERGKTAAGADDAVYRVEQFREKPSLEIAKQYLDSGNFYWNSGIFVWKAKTILAALEQREPEMVARLKTIADTWGDDGVFQREFEAIQGKSIDYAVMEHYDNVSVVEATFDWDDVGSWRSLERLLPQDDDGNTVIGKHVSLQTNQSIVRSEGEHLVVTMGLKNCLVVHTPDATLVANKEDEEAVRQVVNLLNEKGWSEYL